jgi:hypothetical protein
MGVLLRSRGEEHERLAVHLPERGASSNLVFAVDHVQGTALLDIRHMYVSLDVVRNSRSVVGPDELPRVGQFQFS